MKKDNVFKIVFSTLFFAIIAFLILTMNIMGETYSSIEQRNLAGFPITRNSVTGKLDISRASLQNWISDNIGQREKLLRLYVDFKFKGLGQSTSERVLVGKDGWLFYTLDRNIEIATGEYPLTEDYLELIAENQQAISDYYKSVGIDYILMLTPSKVSIYPEYLPMSDKTISKTPVDVVEEYLHENTDVIVYNSKKALLDAKNNGAKKLFHKTDTHWTQEGSYYAYKGLHQIMVENGILNDEAIEVQFGEGESKGEFSAMLGNYDLLPPEKVPIANWDSSSLEQKSSELYNKIVQVEEQKGLPGFEANLLLNENKKNCVQIYSDSQINLHLYFPLFLSEHFGKTVKYAIRNPDIEVDSIANPNVVIFQCAERYINTYLPQYGNVPHIASENDIPDISFPSQQISYYGMWLDALNYNDLNSSGIAQGEIPKTLYDNSNAVTLSGWAVDFSTNKPLSNLYLKVSDKTIKCQYGIERTSVSDFFKNEDLRMTGFRVTIPTSYLDDVNEIEFVQVGGDGTYRFESVIYKLKE